MPPGTEAGGRGDADFSTKGLSATEIVAVVKAWQGGALTLHSTVGIFRRGGVLPEGRTNEEETALIEATTKYPKDTTRSGGPQNTLKTQI